MQPEQRDAAYLAQRHVIAHEYGAIKHDRIWLVVTVSLPDLVAKLGPLIPPGPEATG